MKQREVAQTTTTRLPNPILLRESGLPNRCCLSACRRAALSPDDEVRVDRERVGMMCDEMVIG